MVDTSVKIDEKRRNGLRLRAVLTKPRTDMRNLLDVILEQAGVPRITDQELKRKWRLFKMSNKIDELIERLEKIADDFEKELEK